MEKYYINDDTIIFNCEFNEPLDEYIGIITNYKKLIFSNYHDYKLCLETNNNYIETYHRLYKESNFNQPVDEGCFGGLKNLIQLTFGFNFNQLVKDVLVD